MPVDETRVSSRFAQAYRTCPLCEAEEIEYEFVIDGSALSRCHACTLLFANPTPERSASQPSNGIGDVHAALYAFATGVLGREPRSVLIVAAEPVPTNFPAVQRAPADIGSGERFDLVVAAGVVQHESDPVELARRLRASVAEDGVLLVLVPSIESADARSLKQKWPAFRSKAAWYFDVDTVQLVLTRAGFADFHPLIDAGDCTPKPTPELHRFFRSNLAIVARPVRASAPRRLSVIVPVYNEAATVAELLDHVLAKTIDGIDIEVIIVESNSTDGSREIVSRYADHPRVNLLFEERPRGKGYAVRTGLNHATGEVVLFQDADLEYDVNDYDKLVAPLFALRRNYILGSRHNPAGDGWKIRQFERLRALSALMNVAHVVLLKAFNTLYGQSLFDPFTMFKVFRRDCLAGLSFECNRFDFDFEINIKLIRKGYKPHELLVNYVSRAFGEGKKVSFLRDPPTWIRAMLRLRRVPLYTFRRQSP